jgi:hypothetical protein
MTNTCSAQESYSGQVIKKKSISLSFRVTPRTTFFLDRESYLRQVTHKKSINLTYQIILKTGYRLSYRYLRRLDRESYAARAQISRYPWDIDTQLEKELTYTGPRAQIPSFGKRQILLQYKFIELSDDLRLRVRSPPLGIYKAKFINNVSTLTTKAKVRFRLSFDRKHYIKNVQIKLTQILAIRKFRVSMQLRIRYRIRQEELINFINLSWRF